MQEELNGKGVLRRLEHPVAEWPVAYQFAITTVIASKPGFPPVTASAHSLGRISALNAQEIPAGYYQLTAEDGEILRVKNLGFGQWTILAPL